jgi:hypothetical protein
VRAQKYARSLLKRSDFLEAILEKIGGHKPKVSCLLTTDNLVPFFCNLTKKKSLKAPHIYPQRQDWAQILKNVCRQFPSLQSQRAFLEGLSPVSAYTVKIPSMVGASQETLEGLKIALTNLESANAYFDLLSTDPSLQEIVPHFVYFKIAEPGMGQENRGVNYVRLGYIVEDAQGNVLFANYDQWLNLSDTILSFAHGVQGMRIGEKRTLFMHPAFGYGVMTTLPPCSALVIKVHLMDVSDRSSLTLRPLEPLDLSWIKNPEFYAVLKESIERYPGFMGAFYREMLEKICPEIDRAWMCSQLVFE